jgi:choline dehydrogenase-like flavoprotein
MRAATTIPDVCIIGAGIAGALAAYELGHAGWRVVVLEAGPRHLPEDRFAYLESYLDDKDPWETNNPERDVYTNAGEIRYKLEGTRVKAVGGTTLHWGGNCPRMHETDFRMRSLYGISQDWPIGYEELEPYYCKAEAALGVSGEAVNPFASYRSMDYPLTPFPFSYADRIIQSACDRIGIKIHPVPHAKNSQPYRSRPACQRFNTCRVCPIEARYNAGIHIRLAEQTGNVTVIANANVIRIFESRNRVAGAAYITPDRVEHLQEAKIFVLAAHAVESARLLFLSKSGGFPDGLANKSGLVGKNFMEHLILQIDGRVKEKLFPYRIGFHTAESWQYWATKQRDKVAAFKLEFPAVGPQPKTIAETSGNWGEPLKAEIQQEFGHLVRVRSLVEQLPDETNSISLDPVVKDCFGNPAPRITYAVGDYERESMRTIESKMLEIHGALGTSDIKFKSGGFRLAAHHMGTCRMGNDPDTSVVDQNLKAHDLENLYIIGSSVFVTGGAANPTLTIAALTIRMAEHLLTGRIS